MEKSNSLTSTYNFKTSVQRGKKWDGTPNLHVAVQFFTRHDLFHNYGREVGTPATMRRWRGIEGTPARGCVCVSFGGWGWRGVGVGVGVEGTFPCLIKLQ